MTETSTRPPLTVAVTASTPGNTNPPVFYQWECDDGSGFAIVPGANSATYTFLATSANCQPRSPRYRVRVYIPGALVVSDPATVNIVPETVPPQLVSATRGCLDQTNVLVVFNELVDPASAGNLANYSLNNGGIILSATANADGKSVTLMTVAAVTNQPCVAYVLTVNNVADLSCNPVAANSQATLTLIGARSAVGPQNLIVFEGESFDKNVSPVGGSSWAFSTAAVGLGTFVGPGYMDSTPNTGRGPNEDVATTQAPRLDYCVNFPATGTWYVWVRGFGANGGDNSAHVGIDGAISAQGRNIGNGNGRPGSETWGDSNWKWISDSTATPIRITVPTTGQHTFSVWMREDGVKIDKVLLTTDAAFTFQADRTVAGPAETPRESTGPVPIVVSIIYDRSLNTVTISWTPNCGVLQGADQVTGPWIDVVGGTNPYTILASEAKKFYRVRR